MNSILSDKVILVTGGTGSFGHTFIKRVLKENPKRVVVFSRDEEKQHAMRLKFNNDKLVFEIGDVRDKNRVFDVMRGVDYVFHAAALKQVPAGEFFPNEFVQTNVVGTSNVLDAAIHYKVKKVVCLSTDKAVYPINAMGMSKALMEKTAIAKSRKSEDTIICLTRYGNVLCSRGSVVPIWIKLAKLNLPLTVTNPDMTRFLLSLDDAIELVLYAFNNGSSGDLFVKQAPASTMMDLALGVKELFNSSSEVKVIGIRHGEKMHETLVGSEEMFRTADCDGYYKVSMDSRDLNYNLYFSEGQNVNDVVPYTSENTTRLSVEQVKDKLKLLKEVQDELEN